MLGSDDLKRLKRESKADIILRFVTARMREQELAQKVRHFKAMVAGQIGGKVRTQKKRAAARRRYLKFLKSQKVL